MRKKILPRKGRIFLAQRVSRNQAYNCGTKKRSLDFSKLLKAGNYLLFHIGCSTIGTSGLNFSVRNGKRWIPAVLVTFVSPPERGSALSGVCLAKEANFGAIHSNTSGY